MRHQIVAKLKTVLRPIVKHRFLIERAKYVGTTVLDPQKGNDQIAQFLRERRPMAAGKIGASELGGLRHYERRKDASGNCINWGRHARMLHTNAGVYPANPETFARFCGVFSESLSGLDILAVWFQFSENRMRLKFAPDAVAVGITALEPYYHERPWSSVLAGKRVLVVTPFADTVLSQYARRTQVWRNKPDLLPDFQLETLRCPISAGLIHPEYPDWFAALGAMRQEMSRRAFDVAIIGAGAWGIPLAVHAKTIGRSGIHLGGATQILFGIKGARWDNHPIIRSFFNDAWVRPRESDRPEKFRNIENGCYW